MNKKSNRFSPEVRERAVRMVQDHRAEYPSLWAAIEYIAPKIGCVRQTLYRWVRKIEIDTGLRDGVTSEERDRIKALEREVKESRRANEILKRASAFLTLPDRPLAQVLKDLWTSIATPTGSSRSAKHCRLPRLATVAMLRANVRPRCVVHAPRRMTPCYRKSSKSGKPTCRSTAPTRSGIK